MHVRGYTDIRIAHGAVFARMDDAGTRLTDLAERAGMTPASMSELADDLVRKGYLERVEDPRDRRVRILRLTERGRQHRQDVRAIIQEIEAEYAERLGKDNFSLLRSLLTALLRGHRQ